MIASLFFLAVVFLIVGTISQRRHRERDCVASGNGRHVRRHP